MNKTIKRMADFIGKAIRVIFPKNETEKIVVTVINLSNVENEKKRRR